MSDTNERSVASHGSVADIIGRLLAALQPTLTDAEREAISWASLVLRNMAEERDQNGDYPRRLNETAALMLNLLQRMK